MTDLLLTVEQKIELAAKASALEVDDLGAFCDEQGQPMQDITRWSTAYETGGELGVQAMVVVWNPGLRRQREYAETIKSATKVFRPRRFRIRPDDNRFNVEEIKPLTRQSVVHTPVFQLRLIEEGDTQHWFLYWRRASGSWWPYAGQHRFGTLQEAIDEVERDPHRCFRLQPRP